MTNRLVLIRPAKNADFGDISDCYWKDPETPWDIYSHPRLLKRYVGPRGFVVAEVREHVIGFVHYGHLRKRPWFDPRVNEYGQIFELHMKDSYQRLGIGRRLLEAAIDRLDTEGCHIVYTHTDETNLAAIKLYRRLGFKPFLKTFYMKRKLSTTR